MQIFLVLSNEPGEGVGQGAEGSLNGLVRRRSLVGKFIASRGDRVFLAIGGTGPWQLPARPLAR